MLSIWASLKICRLVKSLRTQEKKIFENIVGKVENADDHIKEKCHQLSNM